MHQKLKAIAWDFDGVLNRNIVNGRFVWADSLQDDLGISLRDLQKGIFDDTFPDVISGKIDLKIHVQRWLEASNHKLSVGALLEYWFRKDDLNDPYTCDLLDRMNLQGVQQVIATNNEHHRASYIEHVSGFGDRVSEIFSSGRIGHAKPETAFFEHVSNSLDLAPQQLLLIDDSAANVAAAKALGWHAYHFTDATRSGLATCLGL
ncbi:HAD-IA family hydrolase [uncultured Roseibium sp.]|uniref:HAD-IA family hydrolase n=1 Tax=uncultured Roseibium sp. TaxID=1936171 RepID=UPI0026241EFF|nr:HAD-IA family hydrolase [uncultured Roseibium sp.]